MLTRPLARSPSFAHHHCHSPFSTKFGEKRVTRGGGKREKRDPGEEMTWGGGFWEGRIGVLLRLGGKEKLVGGKKESLRR